MQCNLMHAVTNSNDEIFVLVFQKHLYFTLYFSLRQTKGYLMHVVKDPNYENFIQQAHVRDVP